MHSCSCPCTCGCISLHTCMYVSDLEVCDRAVCYCMNNMCVSQSLTVCLVCMDVDYECVLAHVKNKLSRFLFFFFFRLQSQEQPRMEKQNLSQTSRGKY